MKVKTYANVALKVSSIAITTNKQMVKSSYRKTNATRNKRLSKVSRTAKKIHSDEIKPKKNP